MKQENQKETPEEMEAEVVAASRSGISWAWLFPILALAATGWLFWSNWKSKGPEITIHFATAPGIEPGKTVLIYRGVQAGTVSQVRAAALELIGYAKQSGTCVILVGHVTKDGSIAGPRVLEHMVDAVLYFEGERSHQYRLLRAVKNRFGGTDEIGVFAMEADGLAEVTNPSSLFLTQRDAPVAGAVVFPALEGTRPVLVELQALTVRLPSGATPRRAVVGWDSGRLAMLLAVLEARAGLSFANHEVYLNAAGGIRVIDPAADLAVAAALVSALLDKPVPTATIAFGEIALSGEVRPAAHAGLRLKEAAKLGFTRAFAPPDTKGVGGLTVAPCASVGALVDRLAGKG